MDKLDSQTLLKFVIGPYTFCVPAVDVIAIIQPPAFTDTPLSRHYIPGLFNYLDDVGMGICMRRKMGLQPHKSNEDGHFLISKLEMGLAGFWIDEAVDLYEASDFEKRDVISWLSHDYFNSFLMQNIDSEEIILNTTFELLYNARASSRIIEQVVYKLGDYSELPQVDGLQADQLHDSINGVLDGAQDQLSNIDKSDISSHDRKLNLDTNSSQSGLGKDESSRTGIILPGELLKKTNDSSQDKKQSTQVAAKVSGSDIISPAYDLSDKQHGMQTNNNTNNAGALLGKQPTGQSSEQSHGSNTNALLGNHSSGQPNQTGHSTRRTTGQTSGGNTSPRAGSRHSSGTSSVGTTSQNNSGSNAASGNSSTNKIAAKNKTLNQSSKYIAGAAGAANAHGAYVTGHQSTRGGEPGSKNKSHAGAGLNQTTGLHRTGGLQTENNYSGNNVSDSAQTSGQLNFDRTQSEDYGHGTSSYHHPASARESYRYESDIITDNDLNNDVEKRILAGVIIACLLGLLYWLWPEGVDEQTPATKFAAVSKTNSEDDSINNTENDLDKIPESDLTGNDSVNEFNNSPVDSFSAEDISSEQATDNASSETNDAASFADPLSETSVPTDTGIALNEAEDETDLDATSGNLDILNTDDLRISIEKPDGSVHDVVESDAGFSLETQADTFDQQTSGVDLEPAPDLNAGLDEGLSDTAVPLPELEAPVAEPAPASTYETFTHIVVKGDTLWDIAGRYLNNPFQYPVLASLSNIKDPHWIYPGDIVRISRRKK